MHYLKKVNYQNKLDDLHHRHHSLVLVVKSAEYDAGVLLSIRELAEIQKTVGELTLIHIGLELVVLPLSLI